MNLFPLIASPKTIWEGIMNYYNYMGNYPQYQPMNYVRPQMQQNGEIQAVKFVTEAEANAYIVEPNSKVLLVDKANNKFWLKWADAMGQSYQEPFRYETLNKPTQTSEYVTKDDILNFITKEDLKDIETKLEELQGLIKK